MAPNHDKDTNDHIRFVEGCFSRFSKSMMEGALIGALMGSAIMAWYPDPYAYEHKNTVVSRSLGVRTILQGLKAPVLWGALCSGVYAGVECTMENMRDEAHENTWVNSAVGGAAAGLVMGSMAKRLDVMATSALGVGMLMGMVEYNGQKTSSDAEHTKQKWETVLPPVNQETSALQGLKEKYPEYKHL